MPKEASQSVIFDVEGTLVDCAIKTTESWRVVLHEAGYEFSHEALHRHSGLDTDDMLGILLPGADKDEKERLKRRQSELYQKEFLPDVVAFPGVHVVFEELRSRGYRIGLATTCNAKELAIYLERTGVRDLVDAIACGDEVSRGKPHPDLLKLALQKLGVRKNAIAVGDTPYDAVAARHEGIPAIGTLGGGFSMSELEDAGCRRVVGHLSEIVKLFAPASE